MSETSHAEELQEQPDFSFGKRLSSARSALNLSRQDVAKELRLGLAIITALEEEDYEHLSVPIFVTGYLRNYARLLKIPAEPLLAAYNQIQVEMPIVISEAAKKPKPSYSKLSVRISSLFIVLVLVAGVVSWLQNQDFEFSVEPSAIEQQSIAPFVESSVSLPELPSLDEVVADVVEVADVVVEVVADAVASAEVVVITTAPESKAIIHLSGDSWVEVSDNTGKRLIYDLLRADKEYTISGKAPFKVFLGNAKAVRIEYNGALINVEQHIRGNLARFRFGVAGE